MIVFLTWVSSANNNICSYEFFTAMTTQTALFLNDKSLDIKIFGQNASSIDTRHHGKIGHHNILFKSSE
jgi:hypothetical protein